jgi:ankyrin repeat protein
MPFFVSIFGNSHIDAQLLTVVARHGGTVADVQQLLANGANPNAPDYRNEVSKGYEGQTALHYAVYWGEPDRLALVKMLLAAGANPSAASKYGHTPLHYFATDNQVAEMRELLNAGADVNAFNRVGETPLHSAAGVGQLAAVRLLLDRGADPNAHKRKNQYLRDGYTPLHRAVRSVEGDIVRLRHKMQKPSNGAAFERLNDRLFLPEITANAGSPFGL